MKKLCVFLLALSLFPIFAQEEGDDPALQEMDTYVFPDHGHEFRHFFSEPFEFPNANAFGGGDPFGQGPEKKTISPKELFSRFGVTFPKGSSIEYEELFSSIIMTNTLENQKRLHKILNTRTLTPTQVVYTFQVLSLPEEKVQAIEKKQVKPLTGEEVMALWKKDIASLRMSQSLVTLNGVNANLKSGWRVGDAEQVIVLNVTSTVSADMNYINTVLVVEVGGAGKPIEKPIPFGSLTTSLFVTAGETVQISHSSTGKGERWYLLMRVEPFIPKPIPLEKLRLKPVE